MLTFSEWWEIWAPYYNKRGKGSDQYVMARYGDCGPYSIGNVAIITVRENLQRVI